MLVEGLYEFDKTVLAKSKDLPERINQIKSFFERDPKINKEKVELVIKAVERENSFERRYPYPITNLLLIFFFVFFAVCLLILRKKFPVESTGFNLLSVTVIIFGLGIVVLNGWSFLKRRRKRHDRLLNTLTEYYVRNF